MTQVGKGRKPLYKKSPVAFEEKKEDLIKVQLNYRTWVYVKKGIKENEIEELRKKYAPRFS